MMQCPHKTGYILHQRTFVDTFKNLLGKMLQVTTLTFVCSFAVLIDRVTTRAAVDKVIINSTHNPKVTQTDSQLLCSHSAYKFTQLKCDNGRPLLLEGYCVTYDEKITLLSIYDCPYFQLEKYNTTINNVQIELPQNLSQLNDYMCGPLNRKGLVCSECANGFGPSVTSFGYRCANCTDDWHGVPLFLFLEFVPITLFYMICLAFRISITSAPMPCFIMYAQIIIATFDSTTASTPMLRKIIPKEKWNRRLDMHITLLLYRIFNLEFGHYLLPRYCLSSKLKFMHIAYLGYISAFYPPLLILLTWICVELHGRNLRPLVWLWKPFHRCFVQLRRDWDTKSDIIDVFTTFFLLSYGKIMYQTLLLLKRDEITNINHLGQHFTSYQCVADQSIPYGSTYHLLFAIPSVLIFIICNFLPPLLLILYPIKSFQSCLSKCHLNSIALNIFTEKIYACYRNGLDGGWDMRCISGLYFVLRITPFLIKLITRLLSVEYHAFVHWFNSGTLFLIAALTVALVKPYQKVYMNYLDTLILSNLALIYYTFLSGVSMLLTIRILLAIPITVFMLNMVIKLMRYATKLLSKCTCSKLVIRKLVTLRTATLPYEEEQRCIIDTSKAVQPLIEPTSTVLSYGTCSYQESVKSK